MNYPQEGAENILDYAYPSQPTEPVKLTFWQTCKAHPLPAAVACLMAIAMIVSIFWATSPTNLPAKRVADPAATTPAAVETKPVQTTEVPIQPQIIPKKIARKAIKTPASSANLTASDDASTDILGDFIAKIEREKAAKTSEIAVPAMPAPSASNLEQDFETRLFNFERKIP